jgi:hypothetical protein
MDEDEALRRPVALYGGPLDGTLLETSGIPDEELPGGVALISPGSAYGPGGRSLYGPGPDGRWTWQGDVP